MSDVKAQPDGYTTVSAYLCVDGAADAIEFYKSVFDATERMRMDDPSGKIGHAELVIGDSAVLLADEYPDMDVRGPKAFGGSPVALSVYVDDVDAVVDKAVSLGSKVVRPVVDQFYGDRAGQIEDPFGHRWWVGTHIEDVPPDEMARRAAAAME